MGARPDDAVDDDRTLYARLRAGDPIAPSDLALAYLGPLTGWLRGRFPSEDPDLLLMAVTDLLLDVAQRPEQYDPNRSSLLSYLRMAVQRDVQNSQRGLRRRAAHEVSLESVELSAPAGKISVEGADDPADIVVARESLGPGLLARLRPSFDDQEWNVVLLEIDGERRSAVYAEVLGLGACPIAERDRQVKRVKDRVKKRLRRLAEELRDHG